MIRRTQTIYITLDPFLSPRGTVLHHFDRFLAGLEEADFPCIWITGRTRAQLDEPRRRLGHNDPFIGESGCGVYLPEDYFHLRSGNTIRLGRFTCIPIAKPQPAAAEALEDLATDLNISAVSLRNLSQRELSQNTGLPANEAEQIRMRDFDELFFFAGASESDIARFSEEAKVRELTLQNVGPFWSLSCGADLAKCVRELGGLYDRALRAHALRVAAAVSPSADKKEAVRSDARLKSLSASCDRLMLLAERAAGTERPQVSELEREPEFAGEVLAHEIAVESQQAAHEQPPYDSFYLHSQNVWENVLGAILSRK
jgi:predicted mannosyl-3-phosphoglycerate phosphatase (HAD superfamily)